MINIQIFDDDKQECLEVIQASIIITYVLWSHKAPIIRSCVLLKIFKIQVDDTTADLPGVRPYCLA